MKTFSGADGSVSRIESQQKVTGRLKYLEDLEIRGMLHAKLLRSPLPHAKIVRIDTSRAEDLPGVVATLTRDDIVDNPHYDCYYGPVMKDQSIVAVEKVHHVGDIVAAVAATAPEIAERALELIEVDYQDLPAVLDPEEALAEGAPVLHEKMRMPEKGFEDLKDVRFKENTNLSNHIHLDKGDIEKGFAEADHIFEDFFTTPSTHHAALESFTAVASFEGSGRLTIWSTVQNPFVVRDQIAELFHLPLSRVRIISQNIGGGYGAKCYLKLEPLVAALAHKTGKPVGLTLTREEVFQTITKHASRIYYKTGLKKDGTMVARQCRVYMDTGAYAEIGPRVAKKTAYGAVGPYEVPNVMVDVYLAYTNNVPAGAFRGFGLSQPVWAYESHMDIMARELNIDPLELRRKNLLDEGGEFITGERVKSFGMGDCLEKAAAAIQWGKKEPNRGSKVRGKGLACVIKTTLTPSISSATIRLNEDGSATVYAATVDMGQGSDTVLAQIVSSELALPMDQIAILHSDTDGTLYDFTTAASRSTFHMGRALELAAQDIKRQLACIVAPMFEVSPEDCVFKNQIVKPGDKSSDGLSYRDVLFKHFETKGGNLIGKGVVKTTSTNDKGDPQYSAFWVAGAGAAEVEVDRQTGTVKLIKYVASADVGKAINPMACHQQLRGAVVMGIGQALMEELVYQEGLLINPNFLDYNLPRFLDVPADIETILVEHPSPNGPLGGAKGVGETSIIPTPSAIVNAIEDAAGVRIRDLPVTSEKLLKALQEAADN